MAAIHVRHQQITIPPLRISRGGICLGGNAGTAARISRIDNFGTGTWSTVYTSGSLGYRSFGVLYVDPANANTIVAVDMVNGTGRTYRSSNGAAGPFTEAAFSGLPQYGLGLQRMPNGDIGMLGLLGYSNGTIQFRRSTDLGATWPLIGSSALTPGSFRGGKGSVSPDGQKIIYAYHTDGVEGLNIRRSVNAGVTWSAGPTQVECLPNFHATPMSAAHLDTTYTTDGKFHLKWYHHPVFDTYVATSTDDGLTFTAQSFVCAAGASWPGSNLLPLDNGSSVVVVYSEYQNLRSRVLW